MKTPERALPPGLERHLRRLEGEYRRRLLLRGLLRLGALALALALGGWVLLGQVQPGRGIFWGAAVVGTGLLLVGGWVWVWGPVRARLDRRRLALLLDERLPQLENLALSSVDFSRADFSPDSDWLIEKLLRGADADFSAAAPEAAVAPARARRLVWATTAVWAAVGGLVLWGLVQMDWSGLGPLSFEVRPGPTRLRAGEHMLVWVEGAQPGRSAALRWRDAAGGAWRSAALRPGEGGVYFYELEDRRASFSYQVQVGDERSPEYPVAVWTPAQVERIELRYTYPAYLGLPADTLADGGPIAGPEGSRVEITVEINKPVQGARLDFTEALGLELEPLDGHRWRGAFELRQDDTYRVSLDDSVGAAEEGRAYPVRVRPDRAPRMRSLEPRGDDEATALEEIPFVFEIEDDHGLVEYGLQYEVAGRAPVRLQLWADSSSTAPLKNATGRYALALEEMDLQAGDLITWSLWARDGQPGRLDYETLGDPYFLEVRPYRRLYAEAVSNSGNQAGGQGQQSADQKQVIIATWNLRRAASGLEADEFERRLQAIIEGQQEVEAAFEPPPGRPEAAAAFAEAVAGALEALRAAALPEPGPALARALEQEQRAYAQLLRLEPRRRQVGRNQQDGGGGGAGGGTAQRRELDQLEMARRRDFAEEATTLAQRLQETEALRGGLEELARRQQAINDELARLVSEAKNDSLPTEEERRLQRLRRQQQEALAELDSLNADMQEGRLETADRQGAQRRLSEARRQMRRSVEGLEAQGGQTAASAGRRAAEALRAAGEDLGRLSRGAAAERARQLQQRFEELRQRQRQLSAQSEAQRGTPKALQGTAADSAGRHWAEEFAEFMDEAGALAAGAEETQEVLARRLGDWLRRTGGTGIHREALRGADYQRLGAWDEAAASGRRVEARLDTAAAALDSVVALAVADETEGLRRSLETMGRLLADTRPAAPDSGAGSGQEGAGWERWLEGVRTAEELLPRGEPLRQRLRAVRGGLEAARRRDPAPPRYELLLEHGVRPLEAVAAELARLLEDGDEATPGQINERVPERYRAFVAEYFKALAEVKRAETNEAGP